jgi:DNA gyrase inhibitor GyrI
MAIDFRFKQAPKFRVASVTWKGTWNERRIRSEFEKLARWLQENRVRTGKWIFTEPGERRWTAAIEVKGPVKRNGGRVRMRTIRAAKVASVVFDPDEVSPRVVYHALNDWLRWRRKEGEIRTVGGSREVYDGNPWTDRRVWARTDVQFVVRG